MHIAILDDNFQIRRDTTQFLEQSGHKVVVDVANFRELDAKVRTTPIEIDVLLLDVILEGQNGLDSLTAITRLLPHTSIIIFTAYDDEQFLLKALKAGVHGYYIKGDAPEGLLLAIDEVSKKRAYLSAGAAQFLINKVTADHFDALEQQLLDRFEFNQRELRVIRRLCQDSSYKEIAEELHVSINTIRYYIKSIYKTLEVSSRKALIRKLKSL